MFDKIDDELEASIDMRQSYQQESVQITPKQKGSGKVHQDY